MPSGAWLSSADRISFGVPIEPCAVANVRLRSCRVELPTPSLSRLRLTANVSAPGLSGWSQRVDGKSHGDGVASYGCRSLRLVRGGSLTLCPSASAISAIRNGGRGTRFGCPFFERSPGRRHSAATSSISERTSPATSPRRWPVATSILIASLTCGVASISSSPHQRDWISSIERNLLRGFSDNRRMPTAGLASTMPRSRPNRKKRDRTLAVRFRMTGAPLSAIPSSNTMRSRRVTACAFSLPRWGIISRRRMRSSSAAVTGFIFGLAWRSIYSFTRSATVSAFRSASRASAISAPGSMPWRNLSRASASAPCALARPVCG